MREQIKQYLNQVWNRFTLEGATFTGVLGVASLGLLPIHSALTVALHEYAEPLSDTQLWIVAIAVLGIVNAVGIPLEAQTLKKAHYSSSASATAIYDGTGSAAWGAVANHILHYPRAIAFNPVIYYKLWEALSSDTGMTLQNISETVSRHGGRLTAESAIAVTTSLGLWSIAFNYLILTNRTEMVTDKLQLLWTKLFTALEGKNHSLAEIDLVQ